MNENNTNQNDEVKNELRDGLYSEILPGLWQGGTHEHEEYDVMVPSPNSKPIGRDEFDVVGTFYQYSQPVKWHVFEIRYPFMDGDLQDANMGYLLNIARTLHAEWKAGRRVLTRCQAGWNRSGLVTALILIIEGYSAEAAIDLIRRRRTPDALCNHRFERFLRTLSPSMLATTAA